MFYSLPKGGISKKWTLAENFLGEWNVNRKDLQSEAKQKFIPDSFQENNVSVRILIV